MSFTHDPLGECQSGVTNPAEESIAIIKIHSQLASLRYLGYRYVVAAASRKGQFWRVQPVQ